MTDTQRRRNGTTTTTPLTEPIGALGLPLYSGYLRLDPNPKLTGRQAAALYREMRYGEPAATAFYNAAVTLLPTSYDVQPGGETDADLAAAEHLGACVEAMEPALSTALRQQQSILWAGWCVQELVYRRRDDGTVGWREWGLRRQDSLERWQTAGPGSAEVIGLIQRPAPDYRERVIPRERYIHTVADDSEGSPEGLSPLRGMYKHWYMVRNIELFLGIALERFGTGLPVFEVAEGVTLTPTDEAVLEDALKALRQNEYAGVVTPKGVTFRFASSPGLRAGDYLQVIRYLRLVMLSTLMADFIGLGTQQAGGAYSLGRDKSELFLLGLNAYQQRMGDAINAQAVRRLYALPANRQNRFGVITAPPRLTLKPIKRYDLASLGQLMELLHRIGLFTPSPEDEAYMREISDLLNKSPDQIRTERGAMPPPPPRPAADEDDAADDEDAAVIDDDEPVEDDDDDAAVIDDDGAEEADDGEPVEEADDDADDDAE